MYVNGVLTGSGSSWVQADRYELSLQEGDVLGIEAQDAGGIAGLIAELYYNGSFYVSDTTNWKVSTLFESGWEAPGFDDSSWPEATVHADYGDAPWYINVQGLDP